MKKLFYFFTLLIVMQGSFAQQTDWLESLQIAKYFARTENKMILMVWREATKYPFQAVVKDQNGKNRFVKNLFESKPIFDLLSKNFVPVVVDEAVYEALLVEIKGKRKQSYIDKFNDDSVKILDANGNILGTSGVYTEVLNVTDFVLKYSLDTSYLAQELKNYNEEKDFYSAFYLASKFIDFSVLANDKIRREILALSNLYFNEATSFLDTDTSLENKKALAQRITFTKLKQDLINNRPRKVLRLLKKVEDNNVEDVNKRLYTFLKYTAFRLLNDIDSFKVLEKDLSLLQIKQAQSIVNINR